MDLTRNTIPSSIRRIHLIAVCGTGMGALACMLKEMGYEVTGSDQMVYPPMSHFLARKGVRVADGFRAENLDHGPDLVVVGNAVRRDNPEVVRMFEKGLCFCSMPQALNRFAAQGRKTLMVTGTHGKTTTAALLAFVLETAGLDPTFMIGGLLLDFGANYRLGKGAYFVVEGDEYDTAFFDKGSKFMHFDPLVTTLSSVEFDHADIFRNLEHVQQAFKTMIDRIADQNNTLIAYDGDGNIDALLDNGRGRISRYGLSPASAWQLAGIRFEPPWSVFEVLKAGRSYGRFQTRLMGEHNLLNSLAVIAAADVLGIGPEVIARALEAFQGVKRRQEIRGVRGGVTVMDDFAHHPTAVRETIRAVKPFFPRGRLIAVFEPRTNSSMRRVFQDVYPGSFDLADLILIRKPPLLSKIPADERFSSEKLVADLKDRGKDAHFFETTDDIIDHLGLHARNGDLILVMSNGGFDNIHERLLAVLEARTAS